MNLKGGEPMNDKLIKSFEGIIEKSILKDDADIGMSHHNEKDKKELVGLHTFYLARALASSLELDEEKISVLTTDFCKRVAVWCDRNNIKYCGDGIVAPPFENIIKEALSSGLIKVKEGK